jgi:hypothetical protein
MKMICNKAKTCMLWASCPHIVEHAKSATCAAPCRPDNADVCVPVRPKRKPAVVWVVFADTGSGIYTQSWVTRKNARDDAANMKHAGFAVRGPVKVVLP